MNLPPDFLDYLEDIQQAAQKAEKNDTLSTKNGKVYVQQLTEQGSCCMDGAESVLDFIDKARSINIAGGIHIGDPESLDDYVKRHALRTDPQELSTSVGDYVWISDTRIEFTKQVWSPVDDSFPKETWEYDVGMKKYRLIH